MMGCDGKLKGFLLTSSCAFNNLDGFRAILIGIVVLAGNKSTSV